jgi:hypothetical protein
MRYALFILAALTLQSVPAVAQQDTLAPGVTSGLQGGLSSGLGGGISSGFSSGLGPASPRTLGDAFNPDRSAFLGGGCAPSQADPDHTGCRPTEWIRNEGKNPNRIITYTGDSAFRSEGSSGSEEGGRGQAGVQR